MSSEPPLKQAHVDDTDNQPLKSRKYAFLISYVGANYCGLQIQPDVETIESKIHQAFLDSSLYHPTKPSLPESRWSRAGRTDKGVSAAGNVLAGMFPEQEDPSVFTTKLNQHLPNDIQVIKTIRVTPSFDARRSGTARHYEYLIPTSVLKPSTATEDWTLDKDHLEKLNGLFQHFVGNNNNFFNYTAQLSPTDPKCKRDILEISVDFLDNSEAFVLVYLHGRSFLLHQIRKMVGTVIAVFKNLIPEGYITAALSAEVALPTPKAPGQGLLMDKVDYEYYADSFPDVFPDDFINCKEREVFKREVLYPQMTRVITETDVFDEFIQSIDAENLCLLYDQYLQKKQVKDASVAKRKVKLTPEMIQRLKQKN
ncbi:hypothetical protein P9112_007811 [Eukaryota sp. TZLM1-RC]